MATGSREGAAVGTTIRPAFISCAGEDSRRAGALRRSLEAAGVPVWRDATHLWPGEDRQAGIRRAIRDDAAVFLACFSSSSLGRTVSYQNEELAVAIEQLRLRRADRPWLIPVRFDDCDIPDLDIGAGRTLRLLQSADLFGSHAKERVVRLVASVLRIYHDAQDMPGSPAPGSQVGAALGEPHIVRSRQGHGVACPKGRPARELAAAGSAALAVRPSVGGWSPFAAVGTPLRAVPMARWVR